MKMAVKREEIPFESLLGKTLTEIRVAQDKESMTLVDSEGALYEFYHEQDCCESVYIDDICGDLDDLKGYPILIAEEETNEQDTSEEEDHNDLVVWTFYKMSTMKGSVTIRWYGGSNGYYSVGVNFDRVTDNGV